MSFFTIIRFLFLVGALRGSSASTLNKRIVNGATGAAGQFPFVASLRYANTHFCSGSIVNARWVLTTATCVRGRTSFVIVVGSYRSNTGGVTYTVSTVKQHQWFVFSNQAYDVAVIQTAVPIIFSSTVQAVVLSSIAFPVGTVVSETGWGRIKLSLPSLTGSLVALNTTIISDNECRTRILPLSYTLQSTHFCTYKELSGACLFDDGGPVTIGNLQVGIIDVYGCDFNYPDVHTGIAYVYSWILTNTPV
ncbi:hypothetical protein RN001_011129 [Aquatica leii]|uniref:Peptidase S1 domain-containing protein n=1 Tax=Aquatica leii TaxID=1421715 RepID=A0AAN7SNM0_9COLE|nr:hypothetical protein RN001_011129 [Aquatica leii]